MKTLFKKIVVAVLLWEARAVVRKHKPTIIAITGSVGKTSTKDAAYHILANAGVFVRKSEKSFKSEIGVPLTILGLQNAWANPVGWLNNIMQGLGQVYPILGSGHRLSYPKCLVLEVGADHPGDIENLVKWLHPDIAVITAVSKIPVHVEFFPTPAAVLKEKLWLARGIKRGDTQKNIGGGKLVLPANDPSILAVREDIPDAPCITFGVNTEADISATSPKIVYDEIHGIKKPVGMSFVLKYQSETAKIIITGIIGIQHIHSIIAASATALSYGISFKAVADSLSNYQAPRGRMNILNGIVGTVLIDDSYNSSPDALKEALNILHEVDSSRKIVVLGDMMELGKFSATEHRTAGERVAQAFDVGVGMENRNENMLITVGIRARDIAEGALSLGMSKKMIHDFDTSIQAGEWLRNFLHKESILQGSSSTIILVKGSQSSRMERTSYALLDDQLSAPELLVRQDAEWLAKK